jgi:hypothetical protein
VQLAEIKQVFFGLGSLERVTQAAPVGRYWVKCNIATNNCKIAYKSTT